MKTKFELIEHCKKALKNNVQYVYGAKMEVLNYREIKALQQLYGKGYVWDSDLKKAGKMCCDCSGLISSCTGIIRNSGGYKTTASECCDVAKLKANWQKYVGWGLWLNGHIGVVSDKYGYYYAMDGSARNMAHLPLSSQNWKSAIKLCDIDYNEKAETAENLKVTEGYINVNGKIIKINKILKDGRNYIELRGLENGGFAVDYDKNTKAVNLRNKRCFINTNIGGRDVRAECVVLDGDRFVKEKDIDS